MFVTKRDKASEEFDIAKIKKVINWATKDLEVEALELESHVDVIFKDGIDTKAIQDNLIQHALKLTSIEAPNWRIVAGRLNLMSKWKEYHLPYQQFAEQMVREGKYHYSTIEFTDDEFAELEWAIDSGLDLIYDYAGSQVLLKKYIMDREPIQYMYMATAARLASYEEDKLGWTLEFYRSLSNREISLATPLLSGARKQGENLSSCFETKFDDSLEDIYKSLTDIARISKNGGGVGTNISSIRCSDSWVSGRAKASNGIIPWIKLINDTAIAVNQLGSRAAAITVALDIWHYDVEKFLTIGTEQGELRNKAYDVFPQLVICDAFMRQAKDKGMWYMFDPYEVKEVLGLDLVNLHNKEFEQAYAACCLAADANRLTLVKKLPAKDLMKLIIKTQVETSLPYVFFKDKVNRLNPNNHTGLILNANLCVSGDTKILTDEGYKEISTVAGTSQRCWNGREYTLVDLVKTNEKAELLELTFSTGDSLKCTPYHKFYIKADNSLGMVEVRASELTEQDTLIDYFLPGLYGKVSGVSLVSKSKVEGSHPTYCGTEFLRNMLVFEGILTGNCVESFSNTSTHEHHVCSLSSINLAYTSKERISHVAKLTTRLLDNVIDLTSEPTEEASAHTIKYRTIGVGVLGLADFFVKENLTYESAYSQGIISDIFEEICIACIEESIDLAEESGAYPAFRGSQWDTGERINTFKKFSKFPAQWDNLQDRINRVGIRNSQMISPAPNTSTSLLQNATASVLPPYNVFFYNSSSEGMVPIMPPYLNQDTLLLYKKYSNYSMSKMIDYIEHMMRWVDTGLSFELIYDLNNPTITAKTLYDNIFKVWESDSIKTMYYIRFVQKDGSITEKEECVACAG